ncbi:MAG TPA: phosphoribosyltransferase family protein [Anaerolineales bacterium]|nr:phosphoribosyltransferase family protein [Anaerolineales bacterium]HRF49438.1 phosphoribosyltransferase family protein [Anaerolineales bacterium]
MPVRHRDLPVYLHRIDAGRALARVIPAPVEPGTVVLGLPRGGVVVAAEVARRLSLPLDVIVVRKVAHPSQPELAIGAVGPAGSVVIDEVTACHFGLSPRELEALVRHAHTAVAEREALYRGALPALALADRPVLVIDDGIATGATVKAAIQTLRRVAVGRITVAAPVCAADIAAHLAALADAFICPLQPEDFHSVGAWYADFEQISDDEVMALLCAIRGA